LVQTTDRASKMGYQLLIPLYCNPGVELGGCHCPPKIFQVSFWKLFLTCNYNKQKIIEL